MTIYHLNDEKSTIRWSADKNGSSVKGQLKFEQGQLVYEMGKLLEGRMVADLRTVESDDANDETKQGMAAKRLQSDPRFDVAHYPLASYKFDEVYPSASGKDLHGILQLKDEVFHLTIPVNLTERGDSITASGDFNIKRINPELFQVLAGQDDRGAIQSVEVHLEIVAERRETDT